MIKIFTTAKGLDIICHNPGNWVWVEIIRNLRKVYIDGDISIPESAEDTLFIVDSAGYIDRESKSQFITDVPSKTKRVLEEPCGIYLLEVKSGKAASIQKDYGVVCQSLSSLDYNSLTHKGITLELIKDEYNRSWKKTIKKFKQDPSNSVLIVDRYLFDNDYLDGNNVLLDSKNKLVNLFSILDEILPQTFNSTYHIGIIARDIENGKKCQASFGNSDIAGDVQAIIPKLNRNYEISTDIIFVSRNEGLFKDIHNRQIFTNTLVLTALHQLSAFDANGRSKVSQTIDVRTLFEPIIYEPESDCKAQRINDDLEKFRKYIALQKAGQSTAELYCDGNKMGSFKKIRHRFLK